MPESRRSQRSAEGRDEPVDDGRVRQRLYLAKTGRWTSRNQRPEAAILDVR
jgi:hypothetical protein